MPKIKNMPDARYGTGDFQHFRTHNPPIPKQNLGSKVSLQNGSLSGNIPIAASSGYSASMPTALHLVCSKTAPCRAPAPFAKTIIGTFGCLALTPATICLIGSTLQILEQLTGQFTRPGIKNLKRSRASFHLHAQIFNGAFNQPIDQLGKPLLSCHRARQCQTAGPSPALRSYS